MHERFGRPVSLSLALVATMASWQAELQHGSSELERGRTRSPAIFYYFLGAFSFDMPNTSRNDKGSLENVVLRTPVLYCIVT